MARKGEFAGPTDEYGEDPWASKIRSVKVFKSMVRVHDEQPRDVVGLDSGPGVSGRCPTSPGLSPVNSNRIIADTSRPSHHNNLSANLQKRSRTLELKRMTLPFLHRSRSVRGRSSHLMVVKPSLTSPFLVSSICCRLRHCRREHPAASARQFLANHRSDHMRSKHQVSVCK